MTITINPDCIHYPACKRNYLRAMRLDYPSACFDCDLCMYNDNGRAFTEIDSPAEAAMYLGQLREILTDPALTAPFLYPLKLGVFRKVGETVKMIEVHSPAKSPAVRANRKAKEAAQ